MAWRAFNSRSTRSFTSKTYLTCRRGSFQKRSQKRSQTRLTLRATTKGRRSANKCEATECHFGNQYGIYHVSQSMSPPHKSQTIGNFLHAQHLVTKYSYS